MSKFETGLTRIIDIPVGKNKVLEVKIPLPDTPEETRELAIYLKENGVDINDVLDDWFMERPWVRINTNEEYITESSASNDIPMDLTLSLDFMNESYADEEGEYHIEGFIGQDSPIKWRMSNGKINVTESVSVICRKTKRKYFLTKGSNITGRYIFAGKGGNKPLRIAQALADNYNNNKDDWFHARARCFVNIESSSIEGDLHWCESHDIGAVMRDIKEWYNMKNNSASKTNLHTTPPPAVLTESGIVIEGGETIKDGKIVDIAKRASRLLKDGKDEEFMELMIGSEYDALDKNSRRTLLATRLPGCLTNILGEMVRIEYASVSE